jgi:hypothetical protein
MFKFDKDRKGYTVKPSTKKSNGTKPAVKSSDTIQAIPPYDYKGSQADWMTKLQERGLWDGEGWHGDIEIPSDDWWEILEECESE